MDENLHNIEDLFHSALNDIEENVSINVWEAVNNRLDTENTIPKNRKYPHFKIIAFMLVFLLASFALYDINTKYSTPPKDSISHKNELINAGNQRNSNIVADLNPIIKNDSSDTTINKILLTNTKSDVNENVNIKDEVIIDNFKRRPLNNSLLRKKYKINFINKNILCENHTVSLFKQKKKCVYFSPIKLKVKEILHREEKQDLINPDYEQHDQEKLSFSKLNYVLIDTFKGVSHDSIYKIYLSLFKIDSTGNTVNNNLMIKNKITKSFKFFITPFLSPDVGWYRLQNNKLNNTQENANKIEKEEKHEFSTTNGILVDFKLSKHWGIQSGLTLSNTNISVDPKTIYAQQDYMGSIKYRINTSSGYGYVLPSFSSNPVVGDSLYAFTSTHSLQYIGIPLILTYNVSIPKFSFNIFSGISVNFLTKAKLETTLEKGFNNEMEKVDNLHGVNKMYYSGLVGAGINYKLTKNTFLALAPTMRFALNSINTDALVKSYPMSIGFAMGLKVGLK